MIQFKDLKPGMVLYDMVDNSLITRGYIVYLEFIKSQAVDFVIYDRIVVNNSLDTNNSKRIEVVYAEKAWAKGWILTNGSASEISRGQMKMAIKAVFNNQ